MRRTQRTYDIAFDELPASSRLALSSFSEDSDDVITRWVVMGNRPKAERIESPNAWFKRNAYRFLKRYVDANMTDVFDHAIQDLTRRSIKDPKLYTKRHLVGLDAIRDNPFKLGLFAMFSDASLSTSDRHVFGNQMLYAHQHDVPAQHLLAFIRAAGSPDRIAAKLHAGDREMSINFG